MKAAATAVTLAALAGAGCARGHEAPPEVVRGFAGAAARGDWDRAYARMSDGYRRRTPLARFRAEMEADRASVLADAAVMSSRGAAGDAPARAVVDAPGGSRVPLVLERGEWKLDEQPLRPYGQESPRAALRTFVRAVGERRYDVVLRLVPARRRREITVEALRTYWEGPGSEPHRRVIEALRAALEAPIAETGAEARLPYGGSGGQDGTVRFLLEDGVWKIEDVE